MSETYKNQNYVEMLTSLCSTELETAELGNLNLKRLPNLKSLVLISDKNVKYIILNTFLFENFFLSLIHAFKGLLQI